MGVYEEMKKREDSKVSTVHVEFTKNDSGTGMDVSLKGVSTDELKHLMVAFAKRICDNEDINEVELYAKLTLMSFMKYGGK